MFINSDKCKLKDLQLHKPVDESSYHYLSAVYVHENDTGIYEITIPKINLPVQDSPIINVPYKYNRLLSDPPTVNIGFGDLYMLEDEHDHIYYEKLIEEKIHDMTLSEIEKKLGFKVRVISEKEK